ncbi:HSP90 family protein [Paenibacillus sp. PK3_47]|uniref:HSP90 family protein n=1 Tax=Paenibacillus sp. PK3_47 TaxID=2072642 RepID=UPI00201DDC63|nr:HSP90 family protein [Paenibacillus sp. PK3_47]UQZ34810.1 HSP90 family protein [Paenibacillus sp. PK3_47]
MENHNQDTYRFQVNLSGMINILSNHLYSSPKVFLRELLQNGIDAITARQAYSQGGYEGKIHVEVSGTSTGATLLVEDNGIGLNEEEIHEFLAMIGQSSKRGEDFLQVNTSFIGRFGIGLLSCFMVSDDIVMVTQSAKGGPALEWRGKPDGTYTIRKLEGAHAPGTKVFLRCKKGSESYFEEDNLQEWLFHYGALLPYPIQLVSDHSTRLINPLSPPWVQDPQLARKHREEVLAFGKHVLGETFRDFIPLHTSSGRTGGIAFILPQAVNLNAKRNHRVYLKHMLVSEAASNILPDWAFFVKCMIWTDELQPTASREHFYENTQLEQVREELGNTIRQELMRMAEYDPDRLQSIISLHALSMKALAVEDLSFYSIIHEWLPFESTYGRKPLGELKQQPPLYFTATLDEYRQITHVASAQSMLVVNGGYIYDAELLSRLPLIDPDVQTERLLPEEVSLSFTDITPQERLDYYESVRLADSVLQKFRCQVQLRRFKPEEIPVLYTLSEESAQWRVLEATKEVSTDALSSVLGSLGAALQETAYATLYFNLNNPVIERAFRPAHRAMLPSIVEMLYCNALMMGHYPMNRQEMALLNKGIIQFIDWGMTAIHSTGGDK